ncbi:hypothetical protein Celaphus_00012350 [Cervus elaphus hippelaphus]|uniref:EPHB6 n=1 Tax=Cervus elaphus hippelaphus TaxID=46360 RepID=A0A212CKQ7_CEREH|nr:hypothetical protein Celaphus_00012350 [Cervus elaphus hippelaphus]
MVGSLWVLALVSSVLALEEVLLDTSGETSEIGWLTYPPGGWDEVSVLDDQRRLTRTFEACHVAGAAPGPGQDNWLQTHFVERRGAQRAHIRLHFSVRACSSLGVAGGTCRETFTLYYRQAEEPDGPDSISSWHLKRWTKVDTIAADESFPASSAWADTGACLALVAVKLFSYACPSVLRAFASFPETQASGAGGASLVAAVGTCPGHQPARGDKACQGPPSAPQELWFEVQGSTLMLHWRLPRELGGRGDLLFNVVCKECGGPGGQGPCRRCRDEVHFDPRQRGLTESRVLVGGLRPHVPYILEVQAVNGVSELSPDPPQAAAINVSTSHAVPAMHQVSRASNSITVSWPQPDQTNGNILDYQLRYYDQAEDESHSFTLTSETNTATVTKLSPGHIYGFQVRARTAAGHGPYGGKVYFQTLPQGELSAQLPERLSLVVGSILGALAFLLLAAITVLALVFQRSRPFMVLTELMELGPLDSFLRQREGQFSSLQLVAMQRGVAAAMQYLSSFAFVHRALSAHSVLVNSHLVCKVARLGHSPQVIAHGKHTTSSDVWSFGIVMWEVMSYGERPYWDMSDQEVLNAIEQEFRLPPPPGCPPGLHLLMLDTWQKDRTQRPHFDQLVAAFDKMIRKPDTLQAGGSPGDRPSQALLNPVALDFPSLDSPQAWLSAIGLECYRDNFSQSGLCTFGDVAQLSLEDLPALGVTLAGHQKKLLHHIQLLQQHLRPPGPVEV